MGDVLSLIPDVVSESFKASEERQTLLHNKAEYQRAAGMEADNATVAMQQGTLLGGRARMEGTRMLSQQRVAYATSGVDASTGTAGQVARATRMWSELDARVLENNAMRAALGHKEMSRRYGAEADRLRGQYNASYDKEALAITSRAAKAFGSLIGSMGGG